MRNEIITGYGNKPIGTKGQYVLMDSGVTLEEVLRIDDAKSVTITTDDETAKTTIIEEENGYTKTVIIDGDKITEILSYNETEIDQRIVDLSKINEGSIEITVAEEGNS